MAEICWIDLETRSQCDLTIFGLARYAQHPTTEVIMASWAFDDGPVQSWFAEDEEFFPAEIVAHIRADGIFYAQNAAFERAMFDYVIANDYDIDPPELDRWRCSSARAMAHGLPASLGDICRAMDLPIKKMSEGTRLIRDYCAPAFLTEWKKGDKQLMQDYCETDVETMRLFCSGLRELTDDEWDQYHVNEIMNDRGVPIDVPFVEAALSYSEDIKADVNERMAALTDGAVLRATLRKTRDEWLREHLDEEHLALITTKEGKIKFDKDHRASLAEAPDLPTRVWDFVELCEQAGGAAISKYKAMARTHVNGRVFGAFIWNGAGATGRWVSRGIQLQNMIRNVFKDPEPVIKDVLEGYAIERPAESLGRLLRSAITAPEGLTFSDYSQIEARVLPWLSGDRRAEKTLDVFREGRDIYSENALYMFSLKSEEDVTADIRQGAKMGVLACGFGGGAGAVSAMGRGYGLNYTYDEADEIKNRWRAANPWAEPFWYGLREAARDAFETPNMVFAHGRLKFLYDGGDWLWMMLPSGRCLAYFQPAIELVTTPWGDEVYDLTCLWGSGKPKAGEKWPRRTLNHLILSENATQATAADIMREAIVRAHDAGLAPILTVHDEMAVEGRHFDALHKVMTTPPEWADGLPIAADTQESARYGK